ncbi:helix-turn-helix domain-containing protein [Lacticaseibacillus nasuensis]|uniref:helix-turn-helix domain-containing protein n=1 Tax=Lacticaseibacillus nasuensis TaxID=944671 RepID=UPI0022474B71|nr:helix-turn-helix domain-containing protein [Lacticaseibacillus nasuensis]MCX2455653.1 helix-turn-helix domain-containing protein [Lacticaseibacillus nasuensis]
MSDQGWIKVYRKITHSFVWTNPNLLKLWMLLLIKASHGGNKFLFNGNEMSVSSGEFVTGSVALASEFNDGVPRDKAVTSRTVWRWVKKFENAEMLSIKSTSQYSVISIINWNNYQSDDKRVSSECQAPVKRVSTIKNVKNKDNTITSKQLADDFDKLWKLYPRKEGKKPAFAAYKRAMTRKVNPATNKQIQNGIVAYSKELQAAGTEMQFIKQGSTFFSQEAWQDYTAIAEQQEAAKPKFDPDQWVLDTFSVYGSISQVLREIQDNNVPVDPERAKRLITEHLSSLGRDAASYS